MWESVAVRDGLFESARAAGEGREEPGRFRSRERGGGAGEIDGDCGECW